MVHNLAQKSRATNWLNFKTWSYFLKLNNKTTDGITAGVDEDDKDLTYRSSGDTTSNSGSGSDQSYNSNDNVHNGN